MSKELCLCTILRMVSSKNIFLEGTSVIDSKKLEIQSDHLRDLSTNLLGIFNVEDIQIQVINKAFSDLWEKGATIDIPLYETDFILNKEKGYFLFKIEDVIKLNFPSTFDDGSIYPVEFKVLHTPTKCNFWHFSIRAYVDNEEIDNIKCTKNRKKQIWKSVKDFLLQKAFIVQNYNPKILPVSEYKNE